MSKHFLIYAIITGLLAGIPMAFAMGWGNWGVILFAITAVYYCTIPLLLASGLFWLLNHRWHHEILAGIAMFFFTMGLFSGSMGISLPLSKLINDREAAITQKFCEQLAEKLDQYKKDHGIGPVSISTIIASEATIPRFFDPNNCYQVGTESFSLYYRNPSVFMFGGMEYSSFERKWKIHLVD